MNKPSTPLFQQIVLIENNVPSARGLTSLWDEFQYNYFRVIGQNARRWVLHLVQQAREAFENTQNANGNSPPNRAEVLAELRSWEEKIDQMYLPNTLSLVQWIEFRKDAHF